MIKTFTIPGTLPGLNEYTKAERGDKLAAASMKKRSEKIVMYAAKTLGKWRAKQPVYMIYHWYEPNRRRDMDNISSFGRKVIQDALVLAGVLENDGWAQIEGFKDCFYVDRKNPRIVVELVEEENDKN